MRPRLTFSDRAGGVHLVAWAIPVIVGGICLPIAAAFLLAGAGVGAAVTALTAATVLVVAARFRGNGVIEVAPSSGGRRLLVVAAEEVSEGAAQAIAERAAGAVEVRVLIPVPSGRLSRWLSAEDSARDRAQDWLARSAGALTAAGLQVSGSLGDNDPMQAVEDELRSFSADRVVVYAPAGDRRYERIPERLHLPIETLRP